MQNSMVVFTFFVLYRRHPFLLSLQPHRSRDFEIGSCRQHVLFILLRWVHPWIVSLDCLKKILNTLRTKIVYETDFRDFREFLPNLRN